MGQVLNKCHQTLERHRSIVFGKMMKPVLMSMWKKYGQRSFCRSICGFHVHVCIYVTVSLVWWSQWSSSKLTQVTSCWSICRETVTSRQLLQLRCFLRKCCYKNSGRIWRLYVSVVELPLQSSSVGITQGEPVARWEGWFIFPGDDIIDPVLCSFTLLQGYSPKWVSKFRTWQSTEIPTSSRRKLSLCKVACTSLQSSYALNHLS